MNANNNHKNILWIVVIGLIGFTAFFYYYPQMDDFSNINFQLSKEDVHEKTLAFAETHDIDLTDYKSNIVLTRNSTIVEYSQKKNGLKKTVQLMHANFPAYYWHAEYTLPRQNRAGARDRNVEIGEDERDRFLKLRGEKTVIFDVSTTGQFLKFEKLFPPDSSRSQSTDHISSEQAKKILLSFLHPDTSGWELKRFDIDRRRRRAFNQFKWISEKVEWADSLTATMDFRGGELRRFNLSLPVDESEVGKFSLQDIFEISIVISITIITILILIGFIRRLRKDKIEFRNAWIIAIISAISILLYLIPNESDGSIVNLILSALLVSPFIGICVFILTAVAESVSRELWNEKLFSYDRLLKGKIHSHKLGHNLISGFFVGGLILGVLALIVMTFNSFVEVFWGYQGDDIKNLVFKLPFLGNIGSYLLTTIFLFLAIFVFIIPYLKHFFKNNLLFIVFAALVFAIIPFKVFNVNPIFLRMFLNFFVGLILMWLLLRFDFFTTGVAFLTIMAFVSAIPYLTGGSAGQLVNGLLTVLIPFIFLTIGLIAIFTNEVKDDEKEYVPAYMKRFQERERFQRELEIARTVQLKFLPQSQPEVDWLDVASNCIPAYEVGGDYYDFLQLDDHRFGVVVGDVSGKGVSAAFYMTLMKGILKSQARHVQSPKEILKQINDLFYENAQRGVFISMIYGVFDSRKNTFTFSRAGHNPLISHYREKNQAEELSPYGIAIGLDKGPIFNQSLQEAEIKINAGDVFVFYTDGYSEAMNDERIEFGEDRLIEVVKENANSTAETILHKIEDAVSKFTGNTSQHDDMTIVIIRVAETK